MRAILRTAVLAILVGGAAFTATPAGAQVTPALTVTPDTDLADGDVVLLEGSGFTATGQVGYCQGIFTGTPDPSNCDGWPSTGRIGFSAGDAAGEFSAQYSVRRFISISGVGTIDCAQPSASCVIGAANVSGVSLVGPGAFVPITFIPLPRRRSPSRPTRTSSTATSSRSPEAG